MSLNPGYKTTEFWISLLMPMLVTIFNAVLGWNIDPNMIAGMFGLSGGAYTVSRGLAKGTASK